MESSTGPVIDLTFNDRLSQLLYYYRGQTLYGSFQRIDTATDSIQPTVHRNTCLVEISDSSILNFSIAIPFFGTHQTIQRAQLQMCHWKYLAFGIGRHQNGNQTIACLLKSEAICRSFRCGHQLNLDRGRRFADWTVVGQLTGYRDSTNSLGCIVAASRGGTRLAVANWNVIHIWAIEPNALIEENESGFYPSIVQCPNTGIVMLEPVVLQLGAVCFKLRFTDNENELLAITDRGVMCWNLGALNKGERTSHKLNL